jgi:ribonucleoside-diphosphate reductase alpha chain
MAVAPTASIGLVAGTTPGFDPQFSQIFSRATSSGKFLEVNRNLVKDLQGLGMWEQVRDRLLEVQGDLSQIPEVPQHLQDVYKTSFQLSPYAFIEVAARAQKWIDQAISRNIYLESRDVDDMMALYSAAWERGVKTTYYLHMKPRHTAEQSTVRVNKTERINTTGTAAAATSATAAKAAASGPARKGFGGLAGRAAPAVSTASAESLGASADALDAVSADTAEPASPLATQRGLVVEDNAEVIDGVACPVDPMERLQCESCQ